MVDLKKTEDKRWKYHLFLQLLQNSCDDIPQFDALNRC
jgi:hypothetical protein